MPHCSGAGWGGQASAAGTLRCKVIAPALGHRAPGFPTRKTGKPVPGCCGIDIDPVYEPSPVGELLGQSTLSALPVRRSCDPQSSYLLHCASRKEGRAGPCRGGVVGIPKQKIEVKISADLKPQEVHWIAECVIMGRENQPLCVLACCLVLTAAREL